MPTDPVKPGRPDPERAAPASDVRTTGDEGQARGSRQVPRLPAAALSGGRRDTVIGTHPALPIRKAGPHAGAKFLKARRYRPVATDAAATPFGKDAPRTYLLEILAGTAKPRNIRDRRLGGRPNRI